MPLSSSVMVSREEVTSLVQAALAALPEELRQARWLLREREEFMAERTREAEALMNEVRAQAEHMVQRTEIVRQANSVAQRILDDANEEARALRHQAEDFVDTKLAGMEIVLDRLTRTVQAGRAKLAAPLVEAADRRPRAAGRRRTASSTRTSRSGRRSVRRPRGPAAPLARSSTCTRCAAARWLCAGPLEEAGIDPGRSVVPPGAEVEVDVTLVAFDGGVQVEGTVTAPWVGICRRCAEPVSGELRIPVRERYAEAPLAGPSDEEIYPIVDDDIDLGPLLRDAVVLELPMAPLCRDDCAGLCPQCGANRNEGDCGCVAPRDPRWANLDVLR